MPEWKLARFQNAVYLLRLKKWVESLKVVLQCILISLFIQSGRVFLLSQSLTQTSHCDMSKLFWPENSKERKKPSMRSWKQTHIQRLPAMTPWHYVFGSGQFDLPITQMYHLNLLQFVYLGFNCSWRKVGGGTGVHLKDTKVNINSIFKRKLPPRLDERERGPKPCWAEPIGSYSKCLHARWHRHWSWLAVSLQSSDKSILGTVSSLKQGSQQDFIIIIFFN